MVNEKIIPFKASVKVHSENSNVRVLAAELNAFTRFLAEFGFDSDAGPNADMLVGGELRIDFPNLEESDSAYAAFVSRTGMSNLQRSIFLLTMLPELRPGILDQLFIYDQRIEKGPADLGGVKGKSFTGFIPTIETALFLFAGYNLEKRFRVLTEFYDDAPLVRQGILLVESDNGETFASRKIEVSKDILALVTETEMPSPHFCSDFPAKRLETSLTWSDNEEENHLILNPNTLNGLTEMINWIKYQHCLTGMKLMPGYRCLFFGPPGTGKTLTAGLLGKRYGKPVYRIDLSLMVSKYIGETEKNLEKVFSMAENKDWILFFDEADALFGKRTEVNSSNDKFANQETSFLLQRVEEFPGLVILATNYKENLDQAFIRRFQSIIHFPMPSASERLLLWQKALSKVSTDSHENGDGGYHFEYEDNADIETVSQKAEISGASIDNVIRYCVLRALDAYFSGRPNNKTKVHHLSLKRKDILKAIKRETNKEGRII